MQSEAHHVVDHVNSCVTMAIQIQYSKGYELWNMHWKCNQCHATSTYSAGADTEHDVIFGPRWPSRATAPEI